MKRAISLALAAACATAACRGATAPAPSGDRAGIAAEGSDALGSLTGILLTNASGLDSALVPLPRAEVIVVRVGDLLPPSDSLRNPADGGGGPFAHCGGVTDDAARTRSDDDGRFAVTGLTPGSYDVMVVAAAGWGFTAYCAYQIRGGAAAPVTIYVPPGELSTAAPRR